MFFWLTRLLLHPELVNLYLHGSDHEKVVFVLVKGGGLKLKPRRSASFVSLLGTLSTVTLRTL